MNEFILKTDELLKNMPNEPIYYVDYIFEGCGVQPQPILDIAALEDLWGKDMDEPYIAIQKLNVSADMLTLMSPDKRPTLKITLPNRVSLIKFGSNEEEYNKLLSQGYITLDIVGRCNKNEWNGNISAQILIEDYNIIGESKYYF